MNERTCPNCEVKFSHGRRHKKFCSGRCTSIYNNRKRYYKNREMPKPVIRSLPEDEGVKNLVLKICSLYQIEYSDLISKDRRTKFVIPRQIFSYEARFGLGLKTIEIGAILRQDHTSVVHSYETAKDRIATNDSKFLHYWNIWKESAPKYLVP